MESSNLIEINPTELWFCPSQSGKTRACNIQLTNKTRHQTIAFKVITTAPTEYMIKPSTGILLAGSACNVRFTKHPESNILSWHKFAILCATVGEEHPAADKIITGEMFEEAPGRLVRKVKLTNAVVVGSLSSFDQERTCGGMNMMLETIEEETDEQCADQDGRTSSADDQRNRIDEQRISPSLCVQQKQKGLVFLIILMPVPFLIFFGVWIFFHL